MSVVKLGELTLEEGDEELQAVLAKAKRSEFLYVPPKRAVAAPILTTAQEEQARKRLPLFQCERLSASLSRSVCSDRWRRAKVDPHGTYAVCHGCEIGARHSKGRRT